MQLKNTVIKAIAIVALLMMPTMAFAQLNTTVPGGSGLSSFDRLFGCPPTGTGSQVVVCIAEKVLNALLAVAFIIAVIFLVLGGFRYIVSQGNEETVEKAKGTITNAIIGIVVIILSYVILQLVFNILRTGL